jgi:hypothetical protein
MTDPRSRSLQLPAIARKAERRFGARAGVALLAFAIVGESRF